MKKRPEWCVVLDFDGTLTPKGPSHIAVVDRTAVSPTARAAMDAMRERYQEQVLRGTLGAATELDWMRETLEVYIQDDLTDASVRAALRDVGLRPGVGACLRWLKRRRIPTAVVSCGIRRFIRLILENHGLDATVDEILATDLTPDPDTVHFTGYDPNSLVVTASKGLWSRQFAAEHGVPLDRLLAVGDSGTDRYLGHLKVNRLGLAGSPEEAARLAPFMGEVVISEAFVPVTVWLRAKMGLK